MTIRQLDGVDIVVTRPEGQATPLVTALTEHGANVTALAMVAIKAVDASDWPDINWSDLDMLIFVSQNAVHYLMAGLTTPLPDTIQLVAVGASTASCLTDYHLEADVVAPPPAGSESLLALPAMQDMTNKQVLIVRGNGGRELIAETLRERGAKIQYLSVYQRCIPAHQEQDIAKVLKTDWLIVTSVAGLKHLCQLVRDEKVKQIALLVVSERIRQVAIELGFQHIVVSDDATDAAVIERIVEMGRSNGK